VFIFVVCRGIQLATASGDTTVKIWDFAKAECMHTFTDHQKPGKYVQ
jgi:WD40 repeat protein